MINSLKQRLKQNYPDLIRLLRLIKYEFDSRVADIAGRISPAHRRKVKALRQLKSLKLHIASGGSVIPGWTNIDVVQSADIRMDLRRHLPLKSDSVHLIFCEHFADHISYPHGIRRLLSECYRILEPGGCARFVLHDGRGLMKAYIDHDQRYFKVAELDKISMIEAVNQLFRFNDFHQFIYDYDLFKSLLEEAGFSTVVQQRYRVSGIPDLAQDYIHDSREMMSMYIEASKSPP